MPQGEIYRLEQSKEYTNEKVTDGAIVGVMLDMHNGTLSFTLDGKNLGIAS